MHTLYAGVSMDRLDKPIRISEETRMKLIELKRGHENYDHVINRLIEHYMNRNKKLVYCNFCDKKVSVWLYDFENQFYCPECGNLVNINQRQRS